MKDLKIYREFFRHLNRYYDWLKLYETKRKEYEQSKSVCRHHLRAQNQTKDWLDSCYQYYSFDNIKEDFNKYYDKKYIPATMMSINDIRRHNAEDCKDKKETVRKVQHLCELSKKLLIEHLEKYGYGSI